MARSNNERLRMGRPKLNSNGNGSYRRGGSTRRMEHGGRYHSPNLPTGRKSMVQPSTPGIQNRQAITSNYSNLGYGDYDYLVPNAIAECPALAQGYGYNAVEILNDRCPNTSGVQQLRLQLNQDMGGDMIMWYFIWCICCIANTCSSECGRCPKRKKKKEDSTL